MGLQRNESGAAARDGFIGLFGWTSAFWTTTLYFPAPPAEPLLLLRLLLLLLAFRNGIEAR